MYRNTYLELYKSHSNQQSSLSKLFTHFTQVYHTMGCVLQDLEYHIGQLTCQKANQKTENAYSSFNKKGNNKSKDKEIIKVQASLSQNLQGNIPQLREKPQLISSIKRGYEDKPKEEEPSSLSQDCDWMINRFSGGLLQTKKESKNISTSVIQKARQAGASGNDSFDSLFESKRPVPMNIESERKGPMTVIPQASESQSGDQIDNTYEDFLERIFKQGESRKSK